MRAYKTITDPEAFELMADETRRRIIYLLRARDLTVSQIAESLNKTPQAIYHQIRKMLDAGLVEVAKEERVDHFIETYYRATAELFNFSHGQGTTLAYSEQRLRDALQALAQLGVKLRFDEASIKRMTDLETNKEKIAADPKLEEKVQGLEGLDFIAKQDAGHILNLLMMSDSEFDRYIDAQREFKKLLKTMLTEPISVAPKQVKRKSK